MNIFQPVVVLALLTLGVLFHLGLSRIAALKKHEVKMGFYRAFLGSGEPESIHIIARHLSNLLEMPLLFYVAALTYHVTGKASDYVIIGAWIYVVLRIVHTIVHLGANDVRTRFYIFLTSNVVLLILWLNLGFQLI